MTPSMRDPLELSGSYLFWYEKTRMAGLQTGEGRMIIDSWTQCINMPDTQPRRHSKLRANALRRVAKVTLFVRH